MEEIKLELLAPAGKWDMLEAVVGSGADAVYLGGKDYNMRMHRSDFNFTHDELKNASDFCHKKGVKIYVTVNNLFSDDELKRIEKYLSFLEDIKVDAIIVQDLGLLKVMKEIGCTIPLHASVQMNCHNCLTVEALAQWGVTRIITSRDITLAQLKDMHRATGLEFEYFVHGEMCISYSGQCYTSGILFGKSANRGLCMKPCRWEYRLVSRDNGNMNEIPTDGPHILAIKDMCLFKHLPELVESGVCSFKIEGRMRNSSFMATLISAYRKAIDSYLKDPMNYYPDMTEFEKFYRQRSRDLSTCLAFRIPGKTAIGYSGRGEPFFFSRFKKEEDLPDGDDGSFHPSDQDESSSSQDAWLSVRVGTPGAARKAIEHGAYYIYIGGEVSPRLGQRWTMEKIEEVTEMAHIMGKKVGLSTPRIVYDREMSALERSMDRLAKIGLDCILAHSLGTIKLVKEMTDIPVFADFSLNAINIKALELLTDMGVAQVCVCLEASFDTVKQLASSSIPLECIVHGPIPGMILSHCIIGMNLSNTSAQDPCSAPCRYEEFGLVDKMGQFCAIEVDQYCRNHILRAKELGCLPFLDAFLKVGVRSLRIEAQYYSEELVGMVTGMYKKKMADEPGWQEKWHTFKRINARGLNLGAYPRGVFPLSQSEGRGMSCA